MKIKLKQLWKKITTFEYNARYARLAGEIECYKPQLEKRLAETNSENAAWGIQAKALIQKTEHFLSEYKLDEAWRTFHTARRLEIFAMDDDERTDLANELRTESTKLNEWRREAIFKLIGQTKQETEKPVTHRALVRAVQLKDEHYNNQYYKNKLSHTLFRLLFSLIFVAIAGIIIYFYFTVKAYGEMFSEHLTLWEYLIGVLLFGFLGATTSAILFTRYLSKYSRVTEIGSSKIITLSKIFVGAAFSVFVFLILRSSVADNIQIFSFSIEDPLDYFTVAFVSGFSERLAQSAIETIVGKEKEGDVKTTEKHET